MKRHEFPVTHSLDDREKAVLWHTIRHSHAPRRGANPLAIRFGLAVAATAIAVVLIQTSLHRVPGLQPQRQATDVAVLPPDAAPAAPAPVKDSVGIQSRQEVGDRQATVEVRLRDADTGDALDYATITAESEAGTRQTMTLQGGAKLQVEPGVEQTISADHLGYDVAERKVTPAPGETVTLTMNLEEKVVDTLQEFAVEGSSYMVETTRSSRSIIDPDHRPAARAPRVRRHRQPQRPPV
jgi:hypothetical protein